MKTILILFLIGMMSCNNNKRSSQKLEKAILIYFVNDTNIVLRPGQISEDAFWRQNLGTLEITDSIGEYLNEFNSLQDTLSNYSTEIDVFPHVFAFVFRNEKKRDTIYANKFLSIFEWKSKNKFYKDTTSFLRDRFSSLAHY